MIGPAGRPRIRVLFVVPCEGCLPSGTVRVRQFLPFLAPLGTGHRVISHYSPAVYRFTEFVRGRRFAAGVKSMLLAIAATAEFVHKWWARARIAALATRFDLVFLQGILPPCWYMRALARLNPHTVLDLDDAIFLGNPARARSVMPLVWRLVAGSHFIFEYAASLNARVVLVPSAVTLGRYERVAAAPDDAGRRVVRIGWLGGSSTVKYLRHLVAPLAQLATEGHAIEFMVDGVGSEAAGVPSFPGITVTVTASYRDQDIPSIVAHYDIGVMPLDDGPWERAKCAMKALIYMAAGKPAVCSDVGENLYVIEDGVNGLLAASASEWTAKLRTLISDPRLRADMGRRGRQTVEDRYSAEGCFALLDTHVFSRIGSPPGAPGMVS